MAKEMRNARQKITSITNKTTYDLLDILVASTGFAQKSPLERVETRTKDRQKVTRFVNHLQVSNDGAILLGRLVEYSPGAPVESIVLNDVTQMDVKTSSTVPPSEFEHFIRASILFGISRNHICAVREFGMTESSIADHFNRVLGPGGLKYLSGQGKLKEVISFVNPPSAHVLAAHEIVDEVEIHGGLFDDYTDDELDNLIVETDDSREKTRVFSGTSLMKTLSPALKRLLGRKDIVIPSFGSVEVLGHFKLSLYDKKGQRQDGMQEFARHLAETDQIPYTIRCRSGLVLTNLERRSNHSISVEVHGKRIHIQDAYTGISEVLAKL